MKERILNLLSLCMQAKENGHDCFFDFAPHCDKIEIRVHEGGWKSADVDEDGEYIIGTDNLTRTFSFYLDSEYVDYAERTITEAETYLKGLIEA